ncbi:LOW QUALITY PROTEIN: uncharacterized protein LOC144497701 [Mustelus asterias]
MAVSKHILSLFEGLTCSICQSLFVEPVRLDCGHNFCKSCIQKCWGKQRQAVSCPECQQLLPRRGFTSNRVLANLCEKTRQLELKLEQGEKLNGETEREQSLCEEHREKLILFCEGDETLLCASCVGTHPHSAHRFLPLQMAAQKYEDQLKLSLDSMEKEKKNQSELSNKRQQREISELEQLTGSLEQDISTQFAKIHQYLEDKEKHLIEEVRKQKEEDLRPMEENLRGIEEELTSLEGKILNLCVDIDQQDSVSFLKHCLCMLTVKFDIKRSKGIQVSIQLLLSKIFDRNSFLFPPVPAPLALDPNTAHRNLILSEDLTSVRCSDTELQVPDNGERFDMTVGVRGSQGFTLGKHYWEVEVGDKTRWIVGVAKESANRKGMIKMGPVHGYWAVWPSNGHDYGATETPIVQLTPSIKPKTIGVFLDYEGGQVSFNNADDMSVLHNFTDTFTEKLLPFFHPGSCNEGENAAPLKLPGVRRKETNLHVRSLTKELHLKMAVSKEQVLNLTKDLTCSICQSLFEEPVRLDCEHNFCKSCIQKCWEKQGETVACPECQQLLPQRNMTSNRVLADLCAEARQLEVNLKRAKEQTHCEKHGKKLVLFCEEDLMLLCDDCKDSGSHSDHELLSLQSAEQKYKDEMKLSLDSMENKNQSKSEFKQQQQREISELEQLTGPLEQDISAQFAKFHQYLEDKEKHFIEELRKQKGEDKRLMEENLKKIEDGQTSLKADTTNLHSDIEQQDSISFLKELKRLRERNLDKEENGEDAEKGEEDESILLLQRQKYTEFQGPLLYTVWKGMKQAISPGPASLTLDQSTAHHSLKINKDQTTVCSTIKIKMSGNNTKGFDKAPYVLASEGFTSGRHFWEVEVRDKTAWVLGVTKESANRKGKIELGSENGYWALSLSNDGSYVATESPSVTLTPSVNPRTITVYLDYEGGQVTFYNGDDMSVLHTFTDTFTEKLFPFFSPGKYVKHENRAALMVWH